MTDKPVEKVKNPNRVLAGKRMIAQARDKRKKATYENVGRPTKVTPQVLAKLELAFAIDSTNREACALAEISESVFYDYCRDHPEAVQRFEDLRHKVFLKARQQVVKGLEDNPEFSLRFLTLKKRDEFGVRVENTGANGQPLNPEPQPVNSLFNILKNADNTTRKQFIEIVGQLLSKRFEGGSLPVEPSAFDRAGALPIQPQGDVKQLEAGETSQRVE